MPADQSEASSPCDEGSLAEEIRIMRRAMRACKAGLSSAPPALGPAAAAGQGLVIFRVAPHLNMDAWTRLAAEIGLKGWLAAPLEGDVYPTIASLRRAFEDLLGQTDSDPLTGLNGRLAFERSLDVEMERATHSGAPMTLAVIEFDDLGRLAAQRGRAAVDGALSGLAKALESLKRRYDLAARLGDDRFALILSGSGLYEAKSLVDKALAAVRGQSAEPDAVFTTCSAGLACYKGRQPVSPRELMELAETALAQAKAPGGNQAICAPIPDMSASPKSALVQANEKQFLFYGG